jgi:RNA polymerase-interacting CarD/CdnL/TRCF family regulator
MLKDGRPESLCQVIRDLSAYQKQQRRSMYDNDQMILKQTRNILLGEWAFVLSLTLAQAEHELHRLLTSVPLQIEA